MKWFLVNTQLPWRNSGKESRKKISWFLYIVESKQMVAVCLPYYFIKFEYFAWENFP